MKGLLLLALSSLLCCVSGKHLGPRGPGPPCPTHHPTLPTPQDPKHPWPQMAEFCASRPGLPVTGSWLHFSKTHVPTSKTYCPIQPWFQVPFPSPRCPLLSHPNTGSPASPLQWKTLQDPAYLLSSLSTAPRHPAWSSFCTPPVISFRDFMLTPPSSSLSQLPAPLRDPYP